MKRLVSWIDQHRLLAITGFFLILHLLVINDYGFTWDFHFHFFGGGKLLGIEPSELEPRPLPFVEPDPRRAWTLPYGPLMSIPPVASYLLLHKAWSLLPADSAYHLPIVLWGVAGIAALYLFLKESVSKRAAAIGALFLALMPRYFGDMHNNMKDVPSAVIFAVNIWLLWRLVRYRRVIDLLFAALGFAAAFNIKINGIFIPVVFAVWLLFLTFTSRRADAASSSGSRKFLLHGTSRLPFLYFLLAPLFAYLLWWVFWADPVGQLKHAYSTFGIGTNNIEVILNGAWYCSGSTVPWYYPFWYLAVTTPVPILILFIVGLFGTLTTLLPRGGKVFRGIVIDSAGTSVLFALWLLLPLSRYLSPNIGVIDGIRHFEEVLFPIAALSGIGLDVVLTSVRRVGKSYALILVIGIFAWLMANIILYHPYQIAYFNELVGGAKGAFGKYDLDYWGTSQKAAVEWVNAIAPQNAKVHIVMSAAVAGQYLRPDLLPNLNRYGYEQSDFVIVLNRQSFFYRFYYVYEYLLRHRPVRTITVSGAPLTWIFDNRANNTTPRQSPWWQDEDPCIIKYWRNNEPPGR